MQWILAQVYVEEMQNFLVEHFYGEKRGALDQAGKSSGPSQSPVLKTPPMDEGSDTGMGRTPGNSLNSTVRVKPDRSVSPTQTALTLFYSEYPTLFQSQLLYQSPT